MSTATETLPIEPEAVDGTAEEINGVAGAMALATRQATGRLAVTPQVEARELVARLDVIRQAMVGAMLEGVDYGRIPGIDKPSLFKPGAEKLGVLFQLDVQIINEKTWGPGDHLTVSSKATVYHAPTGTRQGFGEGLCTTRESKYGKRKQERRCPTCSAAAVIKGKDEYGGGWLCWKKRDGCGAKFADGDPAIESQEVGEIENPDLPDLWNTIVKMAEKRARVDAILAVTGASALFTQDAEDRAAPVEAGPAVPVAEVPAWAQHSPVGSENHDAFKLALGRLLNAHINVDRCQALYSMAWRDYGDGIPVAVASFVIALEAQINQGRAAA